MTQLIFISLTLIAGLALAYRWLRKPIGQEITTPFKGENPNVKVISSVNPKDCENIKFPSKNKKRGN